MKQLDPEDLSGRQIYGLLTSLVVPRPIALVTTQSRDGILNCAPFSFYQGVCGVPPIISLSIARNRSGLKDTFRNILLGSEFVVHTPRREHLDQVELSSESFGPEVSEVEKIGFTPTESEKVQVPGLEELPTRLECRLHDQFPVAGGKVTVLYGEIVYFHVEDDVYDGEDVDYEELDPLARLGPNAYTTLGDYLEPTEETHSEETAGATPETD
jgi:flavin reductase (DIM6/NTAB) family NADH-FMN oxidoreductase RutF